MNQYLEGSTKVKQYIPVPLSLIGTKIGSTTLLIYGMLLSRAMLSQKNQWVDESGRVYIVYPIKCIAEDVGRSCSVVKSCLKELSDQGLLVRERTGFNTANKLYVLVPNENTEYCFQTSSGTKNSPFGGSKTGYRKGGYQAPNYYSKNNIRNKEYKIQDGDSF